MAWNRGHWLQGGRYTIERELGKGRFAVTYLARDRQGNPWVIKTLNDEILNQWNKGQIARLQDKLWQEATILAACRNPHIVQSKLPFRERRGRLWGQTQQVCIPMEFIEGETLDKFPKPLGEQEALSYIRQVGEALLEVHRNGLLHRDVKPKNIMVRTNTYEAVLIDFGLAKEFDQPVTTFDTATAEGFAPPELYDRGGEQGFYTDVYSLAATLYVLLTGKMPSEAIKRPKMQLESPQQYNPQISDRVNNAIIWGMEMEANRRPQTIQAWLEELLGQRIVPSVYSSGIQRPW